MKTLASTIMALTLALLLVAPVLAGGEHDDMVTKTFELTLNGDIPENRAFAVFYSTDVTDVGGEPTDYILFCGGMQSDRADARQVVSREDCAGDGEVYRAQVEFERGAQLVYFYIVAVEGTEEGGEQFEIFHTNVPTRESEPELLSADTTNRASYTFGAGDDKQVPGMPVAGAGGLSGSGTSSVAPELTLTLLVTAGCAVLGRRWWSARSTQ